MAVFHHFIQGAIKMKNRKELKKNNSGSEDLLLLLKKLPEIERIAISLYFFENLSISQIGSILEHNPEDVKSMISSALKGLHSRLSEQLAESSSISPVIVS
jgi:DNA-directed RNA polymerase specialized sigma24 family protein